MKSKIMLGVALAVSVSAGAQVGKQTGCIGIGKCQQQGQQQGQRQQATGGSATSTAAGGSSTAVNTATTGNEANSQVSNYQDQRQVAPAITGPQFHTSPCIKGWGAAGQSGWAGLGIGGGKVDKGCDIRETAEEFRNAGSMVAFCKLMVTEPSALKAGITFNDCLAAVTTPSPDNKVTNSAPLPYVDAMGVEHPPQIIVPAPQVTVNIPAPIIQVPAGSAIAASSGHRYHHSKPCPTREK